VAANDTAVHYAATIARVSEQLDPRFAALADTTQGRWNRGVRGSNDPPEIYLGRQTWYFDPPRFLWKEILSGTHPHVVIELTS